MNNTTMHAFHGTPIVVRRSSWRSSDLDVMMLNGLPDYDRLADVTELPRGDWYNDYRRHSANLDMARSSVVIGSLNLRGVDLEEFIAAFRNVAAHEGKQVRIERFVKLPFPSPMPWVTTTVYEATLARQWGSLEIAPGVTMSIGTEPVVFVEGC